MEPISIQNVPAHADLESRPKWDQRKRKSTSRDANDDDAGHRTDDARVDGADNDQPLSSHRASDGIVGSQIDIEA